MANFNFNQLNGNSGSDSRSYDVEFFKLTTPGAQAIVRFNADSLEDLESQMLTVHPITVGESKFPGNRRANCLRTPYEPVGKCPLCAAGEKIKQSIFLQMIQYDDNATNGVYEGHAVVWERPANVFATKLRDLIEMYGPLKNMLFAIKRNGAGLDTTYDILGPLPVMKYPNECYSMSAFEKFDSYSVLGGIVMDKTAEELQAFIETGAFPAVEKKDDTAVPYNVALQQYQPQQPQRGSTMSQAIAATQQQEATYTPVYSTVQATAEAPKSSWPEIVVPTDPNPYSLPDDLPFYEPTTRPERH